MVKGQVNAINYFLTVMAMQGSLTYPHSLPVRNVMGLREPFVWVFAVVGPPMAFTKGQKIIASEKEKKIPILGTIKAKHIAELDSCPNASIL